MFGRHRVIDDQYLDALRRAGRVESSTFFIDGDYDAYWARVAPHRFIIPDYVRRVNSDHIRPHIAAGRV